MSTLIAHSPLIGLRDPIDPPIAPSPYDDEFDGSTLDPKWERVGTFDDVNGPTAFLSFTGGGARWSMNSYRKSWYMIQADNTSAKALRQYFTIPTNCFIWARMSFAQRSTAQANNENIILLRFEHDGTTDGAYICLNEHDANVSSVQAVTRIGGAGTVIARTNNIGGTVSTGQIGHVVGIQKLNTTYHFWVMSNVGSWLWVGSGTMANAVNSVKLEINQLAIAGPLNNIIGGFDFFRFKEGVWLP